MLLRSQTGGDVVIPLNSMRRAVRLSDGRWRVTDADGEVHIFSAVDWELALESVPVATLPALPGTYAIFRDHEPEPPHNRPFWRSNVLGWMINLDSAMRPITLDPEMAMDSPWTILHPDGRVEKSTGESWDTVDEWVEATSR